MTNDTRLAILKIGTEAYEKGINNAFETIIFAINESSTQMVGWTPEMFIMFVKEVQKATLAGCKTGMDRGLKEYGQR